MYRTRECLCWFGVYDKSRVSRFAFVVFWLKRVFYCVFSLAFSLCLVDTADYVFVLASPGGGGQSLDLFIYLFFPCPLRGYFFSSTVPPFWGVRIFFSLVSLTEEFVDRLQSRCVSVFFQWTMTLYDADKQKVKKTIRLVQVVESTGMHVNGIGIFFFMCEIGDTGFGVIRCCLYDSCSCYQSAVRTVLAERFLVSWVVEKKMMEQLLWCVKSACYGNLTPLNVGIRCVERGTFCHTCLPLNWQNTQHREYTVDALTVVVRFCSPQAEKPFCLNFWRRCFALFAPQTE